MAALCCGAILAALTCLPAANGATSLNFPPSDFDILSADHSQLIGHGRYTVDETAGTLTMHGENLYLNGEYDIEEDLLTIAAPDSPPRLKSFRHDFFKADRSPSMEARLDLETGLAVCGTAVGGKLDLVTEQLTIPEDTYAGASVLLPIQQLVANGDRAATLKLHVFNCAPTPKLIAVDVKPEAHMRPWVEYPGELEEIDVKANFGFWTLVIQPFIPKLAAWFDPSQNMLLVGAQLQRHYKGTKIILVRKREASITSQKTDKAGVATSP